MQPTWNKIIRVFLSGSDKTPETEDVRSFQINRLGRCDGEICLLELFPLPSPSIDEWNYGNWSDIDFLKTRESYTSSIGEKRVRCLSALIKIYQPKIVIFYGMKYLEWWKKITECIELNENSIEGKTVYFGNLNDTLIAIIQHPVAIGITNKYFHEVGRCIKKDLNV